MERVNLHIQHIAIAVNEFIGREGLDIQITFDSALLFDGQVIVSHVGTTDIILLDDVLPGILRTAVSQIEVLDIEVLQSGILFGGVAEGFLAGSAPSALDIE